MKTDTVYAFQVENNDFIVEDGEVLGYVYSVDDTGDELLFDVFDDDGERYERKYGPFQYVTVLVDIYDDVEV